MKIQLRYRRTWLLLSTFFALLFLVFACKKEISLETGGKKQNVALYLTDDPGYFDKVFVDIRSIKVLVDTCHNMHDADDDHDQQHAGEDHDDDDKKNHCLIWDSLSIRPGVYDLLTLRNGADTMLATGPIRTGKIKLIRLELGPNNSLVKNSTTYPLHLPGNKKPVVFIQVRGDDFEEFGPSSFRLWMDFDVTRSVIRVNDNMFYLRPVIHVYTIRKTGSIEGRILPKDAFAVISIYNTKDTAYALPNREGEFKVRGLKEGMYSVFINASNGYKDTTLTNVKVMTGQETRLGTITLHK